MGIAVNSNNAVILYKESTRGSVDHGWLKAKHSFSFADYYDPARIQFGHLRVLNDDIIQGGKGFGMHPHDNMEIITIVLKGELRHQDNMGHTSVIKPDEIQVMSAGTSVYHSEFNNNPIDELNLLQIWITPKEKNITPRYSEKEFSPNERKNKFQLLVSPEKDKNTLWINQDAYISRASLETNHTIQFNRRMDLSKVFLFVIEGEIETDTLVLNKRDAIGINHNNQINIMANRNSEILAIELSN